MIKQSELTGFNDPSAIARTLEILKQDQSEANTELAVLHRRLDALATEIAELNMRQQKRTELIKIFERAQPSPPEPSQGIASFSLGGK